MTTTDEIKQHQREQRVFNFHLISFCLCVFTIPVLDIIFIIFEL